jgi:type I restriction enzyme M protein
MLDTDTKRRIDSCRDILVGKVPDPKSQVEQITIALIYKFMDDMDAESEEMGGKRSFFADEFAKYGWNKLMMPNMGGFEVLAMYSEAISRMNENPGVPTLFRDIFKNAYLPYRDPETLRSFLKEIDSFTYDHSERLGDAFEYLLSVLGSQGDAGQFRTPRHIIDFMVEIIDPKKNEAILDPACGTAGFLISSYKHILKHNTKGYKEQNDREAYDEKGVPLEVVTLDSPLHYKGDLLTPSDRKRLAANIRGYDISPDMVRLSLVNMYLHGFTDPHIDEYDTLTSDEKWNETADVILANPPFMSPKGGIKPHHRFSVQSNRSEVLFVDYMAEHLTPQGRAAIVVPEGVIFQSGTAYKQLREMLVKNSLVAVVSLPAGVFNPYSGVKTSILILDRRLAKTCDSVLFVKIENDGYNLGAQRRAVTGSDLPKAVHQVKAFFARPEKYENTAMAHKVQRARIGENGEWSLSGERYVIGIKKASHFELVQLGDVVDILDSRRKPITKHVREPGPYPYYGATGILDYVKDYLFDEPLVLVGEDGAKWDVGDKTSFLISGKTWVNNHAHVLRPKRDMLLDTYLIEMLNEMDLSPFISGVTVPKLNQEKLRSIEIPLPPIAIQQEIVTEIDSYQKIIDGARQVVENYRPHITIHPDWPMVAIGDLCIIERGSSPRPIHDFITDAPDGVNWIKIGDAAVGAKYITSTKERITPAGAAKSRRVKPGDFILTNSMSFGRPYIMATDGCIHDGWLLLRDQSDRLDKDFLYNILGSTLVFGQFTQAATGGVVNNLNSEIVRGVTIPLPSLATQKAIAAEIEAEQALVNANKELITRFEAKIKTTINRVWGSAE